MKMSKNQSKHGIGGQPMLTKLFSLLMLKLSRLIVNLDTARDAMHQGDLLWREINEK